MLTLIRILIGFVVAMIAAGVAMVAYVITPVELWSLTGVRLSERLNDFGLYSLLAATHSAIFAAPFALIVVVVGEWQRWRGPVYYFAAGMAIALGGFLAQLSSETGGAASIANNYALQAFLTSGFVGGLVYWLVAGRGRGQSRGATTATPRAV